MTRPNAAQRVDLWYYASDVDDDLSVPAVHDAHHELIYVECGMGELYLGSQFFQARGGDVFLLPTGSFHVSINRTRLRTWILSFRSEAIDGSILSRVVPFLAPGNTSSHASVPQQERLRWERRFNYLLDELRTRRGDDGGIVRAILKSILFNMLDLIEPATESDALSRHGVLEAVFAYIDSHYRSPISLRDVAAVVHFSPAYLTDLVRRETGRPIHQWISKRRLDAARSLLAETDRSIAAIAEEVGFRDTSYFGRYFSKITGQTPRSWRATQRRDDGALAVL